MDVSISAAGLHKLCLCELHFNRREGEEVWVRAALPANSDLIQAESLFTKNEALHAVTSHMIKISQ